MECPRHGGVRVIPELACCSAAPAIRNPQITRVRHSIIIGILANPQGRVATTYGRRRIWEVGRIADTLIDIVRDLAHDGRDLTQELRLDIRRGEYPARAKLHRNTCQNNRIKQNER